MRSFEDNRGFTIVELLIVIVVIAILAAITAVAFNGITTRSTNTLVASDLSNNIKRVKTYTASTGDVPTWGDVSPSDDTKMKISKRSAYTFFYYCAYATWYGQPLKEVGIAAATSTNKVYGTNTSGMGVTDLSATLNKTSSTVDVCAAVAPSGMGLTAIAIGALIRPDGAVDGSMTVAGE